MISVKQIHFYSNFLS